MPDKLQGFSTEYLKSGIMVATVHYTADPERRNPEWKKQERRKYTSQARWDSEQEIEFNAGGGELLFRHILNQWGHKILISGDGLVVSPFWRAIGGFDHGSANPTAALLCAVGDDGVIYCLGEYYQPYIPGAGVHGHIANLRNLRWRNPPSAYDQITAKRFPGFAELEDVLADPSIFNKTQQQADGSLKSVADLYNDAGLTNLGPAPNNAEVAGMERILAHWRDLEHREPTLKIVCPSYYNTEQKHYGLFTDGCPNLVWELRRARRAQLTAQQLLTKNQSEAIVDKDNHLRDVLKYVCLSLPEPAAPPLEMRMRAIAEAHADSPTNAMIGRRKLEQEVMRERQPVFVGMRAKARAQAWRGAKAKKHYGRF